MIGGGTYAWSANTAQEEQLEEGNDRAEEVEVEDCKCLKLAMVEEVVYCAGTVSIPTGAAFRGRSREHSPSISLAGTMIVQKTRTTTCGKDTAIT